MKKMVFVLCFFVMLISMTYANYMSAFSATVKAWSQGNTEQALSLMNLTISSTFNAADAPKLWYFKARLDLMKGKISDALKALNTAKNVFKFEPVFHLLNFLANASSTSFAPITGIDYVGSIKGFNGGEIFYSPISVAIKQNSYYVLDAANRFVEKFGSIQKHYTLGVSSTPTAMIFSQSVNAFFVSFENGSVYEYTSNFSGKKKFVSHLNYPVVFCSDNAGRVYVGEYGRDAIDIFEYDGSLEKRLSLFNKRVHIFSYAKIFGDTLYIMDLTSKEVREFNVVTGKELSSVPFPKGVVPFTFEVVNGSVCFITSKSFAVGGMAFGLTHSKSSFSSILNGELLLTTDPVSNEVNIYKISTENSVIFPIIDGLFFKNGKIYVKFRIMDPVDGFIEDSSNIVVKNDGFQTPNDISFVSQKATVYEFPQLNEFLKVGQTHPNIIISRVSSLYGKVKDYFAPILLNNVVLYLVRDEKPTRLEKLLVRLTNGAIISKSEVEYIEKFSKIRYFTEFVASYPVALPTDICDVSVKYGATSKLVDTVYYTAQNILK